MYIELKSIVKLGIIYKSKNLVPLIDFSWDSLQFKFYKTNINNKSWTLKEWLKKMF